MLVLVRVVVPAAVSVNVKPISAAFTAAVLTALIPVPPLARGRTPETSSVRLTAPKVGAPEALPCSTCVEVPAAVDAIEVVVLP